MRLTPYGCDNVLTKKKKKKSRAGARASCVHTQTTAVTLSAGKRAGRSLAAFFCLPSAALHELFACRGKGGSAALLPIHKRRKRAPRRRLWLARALRDSRNKNSRALSLRRAKLSAKAAVVGASTSQVYSKCGALLFLRVLCPCSNLGARKAWLA